MSSEMPQRCPRDALNDTAPHAQTPDASIRRVSLMSPATRQPARRSFRLVVGLAFAILAVLLVVTGWELRREFASAGALRAEVERSYDTRLQIQSVFALMQDAETGQRGFIITGDERFLEPYDRALTELGAQMASLGASFDADGDQAEDHRRLAELIARKRLTMERSIDLREAGDVSAAMAALDISMPAARPIAAATGEKRMFI